MRFVATPGFSGRETFTFVVQDEYGKVASDDVAVDVLATPTYLFTDVSYSAGVVDAASGLGVSMADLDGDGRLEIAVAQQAQQDATAPLLLHNQGGLIFTAEAGALGLSATGEAYTVLAGDVNNDGLRDLFFSRAGSPCLLYVQNASGTFEDVSAASGITDVGEARGAAFVDYNLDGDLDIYVAYADGSNVLYRNEGTEFVQDIAAGIDSASDTVGVAFCDYDLDGDPDLYLANSDGANALYVNQEVETGTALFVLSATAGVDDGRASRGAAWGDINNDGLPDLYVANGLPGDARDSLYLNLGNGSFADVTDASHCGNWGDAHGVTMGDYDNDGWLDIFVANSVGPNVLYHNLQGADFEEVAVAAGVAGATEAALRGATFGDLDNDGDLDLYIAAASAESDILYRNNGTENHWLQLQLVGTASNRSAIGARVEIQSGTLTQTREVGGGAGYCSQDSQPVEFGLGQHEVIDNLVVHWPSGIVQTVDNLDVDTIATVTEEVGLLDIVVQPEDAALTIGATEVFTATGYYNSGAELPLASGVLWLNSDPEVLVVDSVGNATALSEGRTEVYAQLDTVLSRAVTVDVSDVHLWYLDIAPPTMDAILGYPFRFDLIATFTDDTTAEVGSQAIWTSTDTSVVRFYGSGHGIALATGEAEVYGYLDHVYSPLGQVTVHDWTPTPTPTPTPSPTPTPPGRAPIWFAPEAVLLAAGSGSHPNLLDLKQYVSDDDTPVTNLLFSLVSESDPAVVQVNVTSTGMLSATVQSSASGSSRVVLEAMDSRANTSRTTLDFVIGGATAVPPRVWVPVR